MEVGMVMQTHLLIQNVAGSPSAENNNPALNMIGPVRTLGLGVIGLEDR